jgi:hypothetical protein
MVGSSWVADFWSGGDYNFCFVGLGLALFRSDFYCGGAGSRLQRLNR